MPDTKNSRNSRMNASLIIGGEVIPVRADINHVYLLETALVAKGYGVSPEVIRGHKRNNAPELIEGKHWITCVQNSNAGKPPTKQTFWTKRGIVRLGFFIKSERAKLFRDAAEDLVVDVGSDSNNRPLPTNYGDAMRMLADVFEHGENLADAVKILRPRTAFGALSKATGAPRVKLVPAYFKSGSVNEGARGFIFLQLDLPLCLVGGV